MYEAVLDTHIEIEKGSKSGNMNQVVIHGTGGMGKTQLVLEYIHQHRGDYSSVFWVNASSEQTTKLGYSQIMQQLIDYHAQLSDEPDPNYKHIARLLGMSGKLSDTGSFATKQPEEEHHVIQAVKRWFTNEANKNWLLIFDNADDLESFSIGHYIPSCSHGTPSYYE